MKFGKAINVYASLVSTSEDPVFLGIAESTEEKEELCIEYKEAFGKNDIFFILEFTSPAQLAEAKRNAIANLFMCLNGPVYNLASAISNLPKSNR